MPRAPQPVDHRLAAGAGGRLRGWARTSNLRPHRARLALAAAALAALAAAGGSAARPPVATIDRVGDGQGAPDVCQVTVASDAATVVFRIRFADRPSLEPGERVTIVVDSDRSDTTGNRYLTGADMLLSYGVAGGKTFAGELTRWSGTRWVASPRDRGKARFLAFDGVLKVVLDRSLLHGRGFDWFAFTFAAGTRRGSDSVPDDKASSYSLEGGAAAAPQQACGPATRQA